LEKLELGKMLLLQNMLLLLLLLLLLLVKQSVLLLLQKLPQESLRSLCHICTQVA
jgi:hypothetical protein